MSDRVTRPAFGFGLKRVSSFILDILLPPVCSVCGDEIAGGGGHFCARCFSTAHLIGPQSCKRCSVPFDNDELGGFHGTCAACSARPPVWDGARAAFVYDAWSRKIILPLKYSDRTENAAILAERMWRAGQDFLKHADLIVPVPLFYARLRHRRYNQAALMAAVISRRSGIRCVVGGLQRVRPTRALARLSAEERRVEMQKAVRVRPGLEGVFSGRRVLLIDDVLTTGATAASCTLALRAVGAAHVDILVAARTARGDEQDPVFFQDL